LPAYSALRRYLPASRSMSSPVTIPQDSGLSGQSDYFGHVFMPCFCPVKGGKALVVSEYIGSFSPVRRGSGKSVDIAEYDLMNSGKPIVTYSTRLPTGSDFILATVSPDCQYVLWELGFANTTELWLSSCQG
jgi:hypothetical protein